MISDNSHCVEGQHAFAEYPNEEAKIYFVTKKHKNPGLDRNIKSEAFSKTAPTSRFFNTDIKPYVNPYDRKKNKEILDSELRYCLNCACENSYKEIDNHDKACTSHPGYWDFGHSGLLKGSEIIVL